MSAVSGVDPGVGTGARGVGVVERPESVSDIILQWHHMRRGNYHVSRYHPYQAQGAVGSVPTFTILPCFCYSTYSDSAG